MEITIVEPSLQEVVEKAISLSSEGYKLESVLLLGWSYELRMSKKDAVEAQVVKKAGRGGNVNKE